MTVADPGQEFGDRVGPFLGAFRGQRVARVQYHRFGSRDSVCEFVGECREIT